jgi:hypothetical protein
VAALASPHLAAARKAPLGLGFEIERRGARSLVEVETLAGGVGQLALPYALRWLLDALSGLSALHEADLDPGGPGFVHGEVTPERLWLDADGVGKLVPLVPAHWTPNRPTSAEWIGYRAPEALLGDAVDVSADTFSVGVMLWEALAGERLFNEPSADAIVMRLMSGKVKLPEVPAEDAWAAPLAAVAKRAVSVNPRQRYGSARELASAIERSAGDHLATRSGMADLYRDPASGSRKVVAAVTVPRPGASGAGSGSDVEVSPPAVGEGPNDVDALLARPVSAPRSEQPSPRSPVVETAPASAAPLPPIPEPERAEFASLLELDEPPRPRGRGALWLLLVLLLAAGGGVLAYPPLRQHPLIAGFFRRLPLPARFAPKHDAPPAPALDSSQPDETSAPSQSSLVIEPSAAPSSTVSTKPGARRPGRLHAGVARKAGTPVPAQDSAAGAVPAPAAPEPAESVAPAREPPAVISPDATPAPAVEPKKSTSENDGDGYGI